MNTVGTIILVIFVLLIAAAVGWVVFSHWRARRLGLPPPSLIPFRNTAPSPYGIQPARGGVVGWFNDKIRTFKNRNVRTATGAYEGGGSGPARGRGGFGALDPDEAWDTRVGHEADNYGPGGYYEEQELGLHPPSGRGDANTEYLGGGSSYRMNLAATPGMAPPGFGDDDNDRGRPRSRSPGLRPGGKNPFDDDAEPSNISLRGVSPRPIDTSVAPAKGGQKDSGSAGSPSERRSVFRENM